MDDLAHRVAAAAITTVTGVWQRHVAVTFEADALNGRRGYGRWGAPNGFPVLYLGRPRESVVIEAYRHLVDPVADDQDTADQLARTIKPRMLVTAQVDVDDILDLRSAGARVQVGLTNDVLQSGTDDREAYDTCQHVAQVAHQLNRNGILAPAATGRGETLVLFMDLLPAAQRPARVDDELWHRLPADPRRSPESRRLRIVRPEDR